MNGYDIQAETGVAIITCPECNAHFPDVDRVCPECKNEPVTYRITCDNSTFTCETTNGIVTGTPEPFKSPIVGKFVGYPVTHLIGWLLGTGKSVEIRTL